MTDLLETGYNEEIITPSYIDAWLKAKRDFIPAFDPAAVLALLRRIEELEKERDAARTEAERRRQQYEALRAGVERAVQDLHERAHATAKDWQISGHSYHGGASDAYCDAEQMVRRLLDEAGGGKRD